MSIYLDESTDAIRAEILDVHGRIAQLRVSRRVDPPADGNVKMLMSGVAVDWGFDLFVIEVEPRGNLWRTKLTRGPLRIARDPSDRIVEKTLVVFRKGNAMFPGHVLERGRNELLCIAGRGTPFDEGDSINIEFPGHQFPDVEGAGVTWARSAQNGLEFTVAIARPLDAEPEAAPALESVPETV